MARSILTDGFPRGCSVRGGADKSRRFRSDRAIHDRCVEYDRCVLGRVLALGPTAMLAGCGAGDTGTFDQAQLQESIAQVRRVIPAMIAHDGIAASVAMGRFTSATSRVLVPDDPAMRHVSIYELLEADSGTDIITDVRQCTAVECSFDYRWSHSLYTTYSFGGSIARDADRLDFALKSGGGFRSITGWSSSTTGSVTLTAGSFTGTVEAHALAFDNNMTPGPIANADYAIAFRDLVLDNDGCAVSGAVAAEFHYTASEAWGATLDISGSTAVEPVCAH